MYNNTLNLNYQKLAINNKYKNIVKNIKQMMIWILIILFNFL